MRILFCNITWLKYYKGLDYPGEIIPITGGAFVKENKDAHEKYNFDIVHLEETEDFPEGDYCLGFVETKTTKANRNQLHIEKINGCAKAINQNFVDDILVIYCATHDSHGHTAVVGWYNHARVYRYYLECEFDSNVPDEKYFQAYNAIALADNCVLLPISERSRVTKWKVPRRTQGASYGFGQSNVWFAEDNSDNRYLSDFLQRIVKQIKEYDGDNWLYM